jgi:hypothetical protein
MPDLQKLFTENKYEIIAPITTADIAVINEVDKASSNIRNSLLGVMNERFLFNGKHKIPCKWKLFVATCNEIPKEEIDSPFWDRFILKMNISRISAGEMFKYYSAGDKKYTAKIQIGIPSPQEIETVNIPVSKLEKFLSVAYTHLSDRTLTFVPKLVKAVSFIWNISTDKAMIKVASILINNSVASDLQNILYSPELKSILNKIETLQSYNNAETLNQAIVEIEGLISGHAFNGTINQLDVEEIETAMSYVLDNHPMKNTSTDIQELLPEMAEGVELPF